MAHHHFHRALNHPLEAMQANLDSLFGDSEWKAARGLSSPADRKIAFVSTYKSALEKRGAEYTVDFAIRNNQKRWIYHLVFVSNHEAGVKAMKNAMITFNDHATVDAPDGMGYCDYRSAAAARFDWLDFCAHDLVNKYSGQVVPAKEVLNYILIATPWPQHRNDIFTHLSEKYGVRLRLRSRRDVPDDVTFQHVQLPQLPQDPSGWVDAEWPDPDEDIMPHKTDYDSFHQSNSSMLCSSSSSSSHHSDACDNALGELL